MKVNKSESLLRLAAVMARTGLSKTQVYAGIKAKTFPGPIKVGVWSRWLDSEVSDWIAQQIVASRTTDAPAAQTSRRPPARRRDSQPTPA